MYCFKGLYAGRYKVTEVLKDGWIQLAPGEPNYYYEVMLPEGASDCEAEPQVNMYNFLNDFQRKLYDDTVWAYGGSAAKANNTIAGKNAWGWTNYVSANGTYNWPLYAGAGQNDITKGSVVGTVTVVYNGTNVTVTYAINPALAASNGYKLTEAHLWIGKTPLPMVGKKPVASASPGRFPYRPVISSDGLTATYSMAITKPFWVAAHGVVEWWE